MANLVRCLGHGISFLFLFWGLEAPSTICLELRVLPPLELSCIVPILSCTWYEWIKKGKGRCVITIIYDYFIIYLATCWYLDLDINKYISGVPNNCWIAYLCVSVRNIWKWFWWCLIFFHSFLSKLGFHLQHLHFHLNKLIK